MSGLDTPRWVKWTLLAILVPVGVIPVMGAGGFAGAAVASVTPIPSEVGVAVGALLPVAVLAVLMRAADGPITSRIIDGSFP